MSLRTRSAVVLAGGLGLRLRSAVPDLPKPMAPVRGRPFLEWLLDAWIGQGIEHFILSVGYRAEMIRDHFGDSYRGRPVEYAVEEQPLGTGGGLLAASRRIESGSVFLALNGDTFFQVDLPKLEEFALASQADWCFSLFRADQAGRFGRVDLGHDGCVTSISNGVAAAGQLANGGVCWLRSSSLAALREHGLGALSLEQDLVPRAIRSGQRILALESSRAFLDIGVPADYLKAQTFFSGIQLKEAK